MAAEYPKDGGEMPGSMRDELADAELLSDEELRQLEPLKAYFSMALDAAGAAQPQAAAERLPGPVDVVLSLAGQLIRAAAGLIVQTARPGADGRLVPVLLRGPGAAEGETGRAGEALSLLKSAGEFDVQVTSLPSAGRTELKVEVLPKTNRPVPRPLDVRVLDAAGGEVLPPTHVPKGSSAPIFAPLPAGVYVFEVAWPGRRQELRVEIRPEEPAESP